MIAIISDIHANFPALQAVIDDIESRGIKRIFSLGDVCGYHSMINECIDLLREKNVTNILGNHDYYMINGIEKTRSNVANKTLAFQRKIITDKNLQWLRNSIPFYKDFQSYMVHGAFTENGTDTYLFSVCEEMFAPFEQKYFFAGHTHVQTLIKFDNDKYFCNPGSVGQPRDGDNRASYAILNEKIELIRLNYDIDMIAEDMKKNGFDEPLYQNLYMGTAISGKIYSIGIA